MIQPDAATQRQNQAAAPEVSTWLSANAGSGKTRVLTDRVARLLLERVLPQNILCLTYTKAAASEMQNRLFRRLGEWSMKADTELAAALGQLGVDRLDDPERLAEARRLFARAVETPGGLRIQTIHSFCASLLRKFPLEAGVSPQFAEMDARATALLRDTVIEQMSAGEDTSAIDSVAAYTSDNDLSALAAAVVRDRDQLRHPVTDADVLAWLDLPAGFDLASLLADVFYGSEADLFTHLLAALGASDKSSDTRAGDSLSALDMGNPGSDELKVLISVMLYGEKTKRPFQAKTGSFPTKSCQLAMADRMDALNALMTRVEAARDRFNRLCTAEKTIALYRFAAEFLPAYEARKERLGWLDFDDLILKTRDLLTDTAVAAWVLYRLDGGLDHILVDEAQDTSPVQWQVIERLAQEFTSGHGARDDKRRTIFVVGDKKQSIYSFQGADPREFDRMKAHFEDRLRSVDQPLLKLELEYSFRSSDAILRFVDTVIDLSGMSQSDLDIRHRAFHGALPGRVDLWPPVPKIAPPEPQLWFDPVDVRTGDDPDVILARNLAERIEEILQTETIPAENGRRRPVTPGDILILVRRRSSLFEETIRACKARGLPVAGADRLKLGAELAVRDLSALVSFLATPEDDLSLAAALRSPLFGWSEGDLFDLAAARENRFLWAELRDRAGDYPQTMAMLSDLRDSADYLRPFDLVERILTRHEGRKRLLARLGDEAQDGIDSLLSQSLAYERMEIPSLTGFLVWMEADDVEIKRQMDNAGDLIRVMTVHGAKGLEVPVVILPDTRQWTRPVRDEIVALKPGQCVWKPVAAQQPDVLKQALTRLKSAQDEEALRLFYVAATRAKTWLIIAAAGDPGHKDDGWYNMAEAALVDLGAVANDTPTGRGLRYQFGDWSGGDLDQSPAGDDEMATIPVWATRRVPPPERPEPPVLPSDLGGAKALGGDGAASDLDAALAHGKRVHKLLEVLPGVAAANRHEMAGLLLSGATDAEIDTAFSEVERVITDPNLTHVFDENALSEVDVTAQLPQFGGRRMIGAVDKLIIGQASVLAVDFKTNAVVPRTPDEVPDGLLRQMGAYLSALEQIFPDKTIDLALLWTATASLMLIPHEIVRRALQVAATS